MLGEPVEQVGRRDHFFDRGGTSLSAVKLAIALDRAVSLKDITRHPVLADLAALIDGRAERQTGLLQVLAEPPAAGGRAGLLPLRGRQRGELPPDGRRPAGSGLAVFAVELPGHDLAAEREPFAPIGEVVARVVAELDTELGQARADPRAALGPLRGHRARRGHRPGAARARRRGGAPVPGRPAARATRPDGAPRPTELPGRSDAEIAAGARRATASSTPQRAEHVGAAYRHDCVAAHRYFADLLDAARGPAAASRSRSCSRRTTRAPPGPPTTEWQLLAEQVDLELLPDGGHHFLRTRPHAAAEVVHRAARLLPSR